ncbi:signal transduction histidine kinase [Nocardia sp. GAS34]|uniref:sensor histidine kinase n=1 Tax=unclassified Nocardia TaxID=2637762 RepID=UPI003D1CF815
MTAAGALKSRRAHTRPQVPAGPGWWGRVAAAQPVSWSATDGIVRRVGLSIGLGGVIMGLVDLPEIVEQGRGAPGGWTPIAVVLTFGFFPVLAGMSVWSRPTTVRAVAGLAAVSYLEALAITLFALHPHTLDASSVWLYRMLPLGVLVAALAWPLPVAIGYLLIGATAVVCTDIFLAQPITTLLAANDFVRALGLSTLFLWCMTCARRAGARVDRESAIAGRRAAAAAATTARDHERARFAALIHDAVLSTLLDASRGNETCTAADAPAFTTAQRVVDSTGSAPVNSVVRRQARATLTQLDEIRLDAPGPDVLDARSAVIYLRSAVHEINPGIRFATRTWPGYDDMRMPVAVAGTLAAALGEAVRNSLRHAAGEGRPVCRTVTCTISAGSIRLVFADDGAGFDVRQVPADRLGIAVSILGRMRQLPGGAGFVESRPGEGVTVTLVWGGDDLP